MQGCDKREHCNMCAVCYAASTDAHVVFQLK